MNEKLDVLQVFPELEQLGETDLQRICNDWLRSPIAREFAVSEIEVSEESERLWMSFQIQLTHRVENREDYYFPTDELLVFIADNGIADFVTRDLVKANIVDARQKGGSDVYRRFKIKSGPKLPLFVTCKNSECQKVLQTPFSAYRAEIIQFDPEEIECPVCHAKFITDGNDLHFERETQ